MIIRQKWHRAGDNVYVSALVIFQVEIVFEVGFKSSSSRIWGSFAGIYHEAHPVALTRIVCL